ncbi:MAG TPA: tetratricopeptide repeat protein [Gemmatimonadota bacterium]|nr:tetratricopeptide repeat protein [Gemmatimonadota bacterium]
MTHPRQRSERLSWFKKEKHAAARHENPDDAIARYLEELRQADVQGIAQPASALNGLGDAYLDKGDIHSAVDHYRQSAEAYAREGMYDNAIACCKKIRRYAPENDSAALLLGRFYAAKGLRADAARELEAYAERMERSGHPKEAISALADVVGLGLDKPLQRERLARLYAENGQRDAAVQEYRALRREYEARGDAEGVARISDRLAEHGDRPPRPSAAAPDPAERQAVEPVAEEPSVRLAKDEGSSPPPIPLGLEIQPTSYSDERSAESRGAGTESVNHAEVRGGYAEMVSLAERAVAEGDAGRAAEQLAAAGRGFTSQRRWEEAVDAYRRLAAIGAATDEQYGAWTEAARQLGMASLVLEALSAQARWHVQGGRRSSARRAAEEMLLVDTQNEVATEILSKVGSTLPRD